MHYLLPLLALMSLVCASEVAQMEYPTYAGSELEDVSIPGFTAAPPYRGPERFSSDCIKGWNSRVILKHREKKGVGYNKGYTTAELFLTPTWNKQFAPFLDLRAHVFNNGRFASNVGIGFRMPVTTNDWVIGGNAYYDYRSLSVMGSQQIGAGFEALNRFVDLRINGYLPVGGTKHLSKAKFVRFEGNHCIIKRQATLALPKVEAEVGFPVPGVLDVIDFYAAIGPYYLFNVTDGGIDSRSSVGGRARVDMRLYDGLLIEVAGTYDNIFKGTVQGMVSLSFPFGPANLRKKGARWKERYGSRRCNRQAELIRMMTQTVERSEIIPVRKKSKTMPATQQFIFCSNTSGSQGTWEDPYATLEDAVAHSEPGDIIVFLPGDGTTNKNSGTSVIMKHRQKLIGGAETIDMGDFVIPPITPGQRPVLAGRDYWFAIGIAEEAEVRGIDVVGGANAFHVMPGVSSYTIANTRIAHVERGITSTNRIGKYTDQGKYVAVHRPIGGRRVIANNRFESVGCAIDMMNPPGGENAISGNIVNSARVYGLHIAGVDGKTCVKGNRVMGAKEGIVVTGASYSEPNTIVVEGNTTDGRILLQSHAGEQSVSVWGNRAQCIGLIPQVEPRADFRLDVAGVEALEPINCHTPCRRLKSAKL